MNRVKEIDRMKKDLASNLKINHQFIEESNQRLEKSFSRGVSANKENPLKPFFNNSEKQKMQASPLRDKYADPMISYAKDAQY